MYKNYFFRILLRIMDWIDGRRKEIYFLLKVANILAAIVFGIYMFIRYKNDPMFSNPSSVLEHFARPIFIAMFTIVLVLAFGTLLFYLITSSRLKIFNLEMESVGNTQREIEIANQFQYASTMLDNHKENVKYLFDNQFFKPREVLLFLTDSYKNYALEYHEKQTLSIDVLDLSELESRTEKKLYSSIVHQLEVKTRTAYVNRLFTGENILLGVISLAEYKKKVIVVRRGFEIPFDTYDQETFESILGYSAILFDTLMLFQLLKKE